jgi:adenylate cyclase
MTASELVAGAPCPSRRRRLRPGLLLAVALLSAALWIVVWAGGGLRVWELQTVDARFGVRGAQPAPRTVAVVAIDDATLDTLRERPPLRRSRYAAVIDRLRAAGARLVVLDVQFTERTVPREDNALVAALGRARPTVLGASEVDARGRTNVLGGVANQRAFGVRVGSVNFRLEPGGVYRRLPYAVDRLKTLPVVAAGVAGRPAAPFGEHWIDYAGPPGTIRTLSFADVLDGSASGVKGRIVVVGASAPTLQDLHATPTGALMSGPEIEANAIDTLLRGNPLRDASGLAAFLLILACAAVVPLAGLRLGALASEGIGLAFAALALIGVQIAFNRGVILPVVAPAGAFLCSATGALAVHYLLSTVERERTHDLFARFVPEPVVRQLLAGTGGRLLGGVKLDGTVLFADLRGFTTLAERTAASDVIEILNRYLGEMSDAVMDAGGTLVSYLGDGILAVFGAPLAQPDHADRALAAARDIIDVRMPRFNAWLGERGPVGIGVGISSGELMAGHVGSERRVEYTAVGDTVNVASRLESLTAEHGVKLLVAGSTRERLRHVPDDLREIGELAIRGRGGRISAWTVSEAGQQAAEDALQRGLAGGVGPVRHGEDGH